LENAKFIKRQHSWQRQSKKQSLYLFQRIQHMTTNYFTKIPFSFQRLQTLLKQTFSKEFWYFSYINKAYKTILPKMNFNKSIKIKSILPKSKSKRNLPKSKSNEEKAYKI